MKCPYCRHETTSVINTRGTTHDTQIWRRRRCTHCQAIFTTYERPDLGHIKVRKKSGQKERYSRAKLFAGIYNSHLSSPDKETAVDQLTSRIESLILDLQKKEIDSKELASLVLHELARSSPVAFARFLAYNTNPKSIAEIKRQINKY